MSEATALKILLHANADLADGFLAKTDGGSQLSAGVVERVNRIDGVNATVMHESSDGFAALRSALESGDSPMLSSEADIVVLSIADDVLALDERAAAMDEAVHLVRADLVAVVELIKEKLGAHVLVANHSTVDPLDNTFNFQGVTPEPVSLRIQRLDLMLIGVSHETGISIIDVDRKVAELGAGGNVIGAMQYGPRAAAVIADEVVRILEDYGFFDDRPLLAQVGAKGGTK